MENTVRSRLSVRESWENQDITNTVRSSHSTTPDLSIHSTGVTQERQNDNHTQTGRSCHSVALSNRSALSAQLTQVGVRLRHVTGKITPFAHTSIGQNRSVVST
ncbi:hypothetical protein LR48_Vigan05g186900 [Vigna angularis]|uniref:Uncharacterized protein n=1 Tax=Phaseolus angularis TaxID=3914 RepID=A0A0L9UNZ6_PHAAN|nr:hypothetical protein LR48_Vigan05g186900 [Vigna angularis]